MQYLKNAFYIKARLSQDLLPDIELFQKMFPTILNMKNANKKARKLSSKIVRKIVGNILRNIQRTAIILSKIYNW